jgi:hypothetical protein
MKELWLILIPNVGTRISIQTSQHRSMAPNSPIKLNMDILIVPPSRYASQPNLPAVNHYYFTVGNPERSNPFILPFAVADT